MWVEKHEALPEELESHEGFGYVNGAMLGVSASRYKLPVITFPSGAWFDVFASFADPERHRICLRGEMDLPLFATRDEAFEIADHTARECGYLAQKKGTDHIQVRCDGYSYLVTYDNQRRVMTDALYVKRS